MKNKKGYTLVEIIVVVAIMGVVIGFGILGVNSLASQRVKTASKKVFNMLGSTQTVAMSKGNTAYGLCLEDNVIKVYTLFKDNNASDYRVIQEESLSAAVQVHFKDSNGNEFYIGNPAQGVAGRTYVKGMVMTIDRTTGKFTGTYLYSGNVASPMSVAVGDCTNIYIDKSDSTIDIVVVPLTGKFFIN